MTQQASRPLWIIGPARDLTFFVATPLLIIPIVYLAGSHWAAEEVALVVAAFGASGHHLPGMMRAYGDRVLFDRYRTRFIIAPIFLLAVCVTSYIHDLSGIILIAVSWGVWHGFMQTYGFIRIYDAKIGSFEKYTARLDFLMCMSWFGAGFFLSEYRMYAFLDDFYKCGGPLIPAGFLEIFRGTWFAGTVMVTLAFLAHAYKQFRSDQPPSPVKFLLMATSFGFWWFCMTVPENMILGIAMFELFHDSQYLTIVWLFNRNRVKKDPNVGSFTRFVFRRNALLIVVYVGMVAAYGLWDYVDYGVLSGTWQSSFAGFYAASALLHFYYDGFIWKVRDQSTSESLGIDDRATGLRLMPNLSLSSMRWSFFVVPLVLLSFGELNSDLSPSDRLAKVVKSLPESATAHNNFGVALQSNHQFDQALEHYDRALNLLPDYPDALHNKGALLSRLGQYDQAEAALRRAIEIQTMPAKTYRELGHLMREKGDPAAASEYYRQALQKEPNHPDSYSGLALVQLAQNHPAEAVASFEQALTLAPDDPVVHMNLGVLAEAEEDWTAAIHHYHAATGLDPDQTQSLDGLSTALTELGDASLAQGIWKDLTTQHSGSAAIHHRAGLVLGDLGQIEEGARYLDRAIELDPEDLSGYLDRAELSLRQNRPEAAVQALQQVLEHEPNHLAGHEKLARIYDRQKQYDAATNHYRTCLEVNPNYLPAINGLGVLALKKGQFEQAKSHFEQAINLDPANASVRANYGLVLGQLGRHEQAVEQFKIAVQHDTNNRSAHFYLNRIAWQAEDWAAVREHSQALLRINPNASEAKQMLQHAEQQTPRP